MFGALLYCWRDDFARCAQICSKSTCDRFITPICFTFHRYPEQGLIKYFNFLGKATAFSVSLYLVVHFHCFLPESTASCSA